MNVLTDEYWISRAMFLSPILYNEVLQSITAGGGGAASPYNDHVVDGTVTQPTFIILQFLEIPEKTEA